jgi:hypothetical protein
MRYTKPILFSMSTVDIILTVFNLNYFNPTLIDPNYNTDNKRGYYFGNCPNSFVYVSTAFTSLQKLIRLILQMEKGTRGVRILFRYVRSKKLQPVNFLWRLNGWKIEQLKTRVFGKFCSETFSSSWKTVR